jgi:F0F1-type ATP synthase assembly protein I
MTPIPGNDPSGSAAKPVGLGLAVIGSELVAFTLAGVTIDYFVGTRGGFTVGLMMLGLIAAVLLTVRLLKGESRDARR